MPMNTNNQTNNNHNGKSNCKWTELILIPIAVAVIAGIILLPITDYYKKIVKTDSTPEPSTPTTPIDVSLPPSPAPSPSVPITPSPDIERFEDYVSDYSDGKIKYSSIEYGIDIVLPDGYLCKDYHPASQGSQEKIELQYNSDLRIDITIGEMPYEGFYSLDEYSDYYLEIYNKSPNFYKSFNFEGDLPYCVFSFNADNGNIYYELIYNLDGVYCMTKFNYPISKHDIYNEIVDGYLHDSILNK